MLILTEKKPLITEENSRVDEISNDILKSNEEISDDEFNNLLKNKLKKVLLFNSTYVSTNVGVLRKKGWTLI